MSDSSRGTRYSDRLVFEGAVARNSRYNDGVIIFPDNSILNVINASQKVDDNEIDLSGSFKVTQTTTTPTPQLQYNLNANCNSTAHIRLLIELNANATSGTYTYPNGTQITFARCEVILIKHPD